MNYYIAFISGKDFDWCVFETTNKNYAKRVYNDLAPPPEYYKELRCTEEPIDIHVTYDVMETEYQE